MQTKLVAITEPFTTYNGEERLSPEQFIVYIARVSNPANQLNVDTGPKLIRYLIDHKHWSPFEHVSATFEIKTSRAIAAQILRHRSFTFQEFSQRYAKVTELEILEWRNQGKTNRQVGDERAQVPSGLLCEISGHQAKALEIYNELVFLGVAKECARMVLPLNTQTTLYMTGTIRSWIHYLELRCMENTQKEHRDIALSIKKGLEVYFPETFKVLKDIEELNFINA